MLHVANTLRRAGYENTAEAILASPIHRTRLVRALRNQLSSVESALAKARKTVLGSYQRLLIGHARSSLV